MLNIAEGSGEYAPREKARFYRIARRSASECVAVLDYLVDRNLLPASTLDPARNALRRSIGALVKLIQSIEARSTSGTRD